MTERAVFLDRVRAASSDLEAPDGPAIPVEFATDRSGVSGFVDAWTAVGGTVDRARRWEDVAGCVQAYAAERPGPVLVTADEELAALPRDLAWPECSLIEAETASVGVVRPVAAVAQTGSVVMSAAHTKGRAPSLLPAAAVFVFDADDIVDTPGDVLRSHRERWPDGPPSQLVFVTGPSRSADIEVVLVVGVHGPGEVHAVIVG